MFLRALAALPILLALAPALGTTAMGGTAVSYRNQVQAVMAKAGCNLGTCHGNANGKGGFKMSLRGDDVDYDYAALTLDVSGRRVNLFEPEQSLLLLKATQDLAHEGGKRFSKDSWEYRTLRDWIAQGAPRSLPDEVTLTKLEVTPREKILVEPEAAVQLKVVATFSDGAQKDVTAQAVYEPSQVGLVNVSAGGRVEKLKEGEPTLVVRYLNKQEPVRLAFVAARPDFEWTPTRENNYVDRQVFAKLKSLRMTPSPLAGDEVFVRRAFLDLCGIPPTAAEAKAFVADKAPEKRERLVDRLMARREFADFWALKWADALRVEARTMDKRGMTVFHAWIRDAVATNMPVNTFARAILAAQGSTYKVPEANFYRAMREPNARAEGIARVFLGTRLQCAQCHNHPFDRWTQDDYFQWSAVFGRVDYKILDNKGVDTNDKHAFNGEQIVELMKEVKFINPRTGEKPKPKLLGATEFNRQVLDSGQDLTAAADWVTNPANALFAQAQVNRIWYHLMGRGLVEPMDDFRPTNPASHPELLQALTQEFIQSGYDMRRLIRRIMGSRAYQLSSEPNGTNGSDEQNYSHALVRRLGAEQLFDALHQFTGIQPVFRNVDAAITRASQRPGPLNGRKRDANIGDSETLLLQFGQPPRLLACECERTNETTMGQAFTLMSGPKVNELLKRKGNALSLLLERKTPEDQQVDTLFWSALSRAPTPEERTALTALLLQAPDKRAALEDLAWSLVNAKEFVLRR